VKTIGSFVSIRSRSQLHWSRLEMCMYYSQGNTCISNGLVYVALT
jgi:hypothetical protein